MWNDDIIMGNKDREMGNKDKKYKLNKKTHP